MEGVKIILFLLIFSGVLTLFLLIIWFITWLAKSGSTEKRTVIIEQGNNDKFVDGEKKCPSCAETIKLEALKCKHCGEAFDPAIVKKQVEDWKRLSIPKDYKLIKGETDEAFCVACKSSSPIDGMYYHKGTESYYHNNCLRKKLKLPLQQEN